MFPRYDDEYPPYGWWRQYCCIPAAERSVMVFLSNGWSILTPFVLADVYDALWEVLAIQSKNARKLAFEGWMRLTRVTITIEGDDLEVIMMDTEIMQSLQEYYNAETSSCPSGCWQRNPFGS